MSPTKLPAGDGYQQNMDYFYSIDDTKMFMNVEGEDTYESIVGNMKQGTQHITQEEPKKPSIRVYLDCSSSFKEEDIKKEENFMQSIARFEKDGDIEKTVIKYFAVNL